MSNPLRICETDSGWSTSIFSGYRLVLASVKWTFRYIIPGGWRAWRNRGRELLDSDDCVPSARSGLPIIAPSASALEPRWRSVVSSTYRTFLGYSISTHSAASRSLDSWTWFLALILHAEIFQDPRTYLTSYDALAPTTELPSLGHALSRAF